MKHMRKLYLIWLLIIILALSACQSEESSLSDSSDEGVELISQEERILRDTDDMPLVFLPQTTFTLGDPNMGASRTVVLDAYFIDQHEVTNLQYMKCVDDGQCTPPYAEKSAVNAAYYGNSEFNHFPVIYVNWQQAADYCVWAGGQLPTEAQWENAAKGKDESDYPWGNDSISCERANADFCFSDTTEVGSLPDGNTMTGISDMAGNVMEWVSDWFKEDYSGGSYANATGPVDGDTRVVRGGAWNTEGAAATVYSREENYPNLMGNNLGFRCVVTEKSSLWNNLTASLDLPDQEVEVVNTEPATITAWYPFLTDYEQEEFERQIGEFNAQSDLYTIELFYTAGMGPDEAQDYLAVMQASGEAPCLMHLQDDEFYPMIFDGQMLPITDLISPQLLSQILPSVLDRGTVNGELYGISEIEIGFALWGNRELLERAGIRIPEGVNDAWSLEEFEGALVALQQLPDVQTPLEMHLSWDGAGYYSMIFTPLLNSFGGSLIDPTDYSHSDGFINSEESIFAMQTYQNWLEQGYIHYGLGSYEDYFDLGLAGLEWGGSWMYSTYKDTIADNLVLIPMPNFGYGAKTTTNTERWAVSSTCERPDAAAAFLEYLISPEYSAAEAESSYAVPANVLAYEGSDLFNTDGELRIYVDQLQQGSGVIMPKTPAIKTIKEAFYTAIKEIMDGRDPRSALSSAASTIDQAIVDNGWDQ